MAKEFGEQLSKQKRYWWVSILNFLFFMGLILTTATYGWNMTTLPPIVLPTLFVTWLGYPKSDIDARLKQIQKAFEKQGLIVTCEAKLHVRVYKKHL